MASHGTINITSRRLPFLLKAAAIYILIYSIFGILFFATVLFYQLIDRNFLIDWKYNGFNGVTIIIYLMLQAVLHGGLFMSSIQILKHKKTGFYIFTISFIILTALSFFINYEFGLVTSIIGFLVFIALLIHKRALN